MADEIDTEQEALLALKRLGNAKPSYFDASQDQFVVISDEFEAFCVLLDPDVREEIIERLSIANEGDPARQEIYAEAAKKEEADARLVLPDFDAAVDGFGAFREEITLQAFGTNTAVAPLIQDIQRGIGGVSEMRERAYHTLQTARVLKFLHTRGEGTDGQRTQRESWEPILTLYR